MNQNSLDKEFDRFYGLISKNNLKNYKNLSNIKELISKYKGFDNWYQLEKYYSIKDKQIKTLNHQYSDIDFNKISEYIHQIIHSKIKVKIYSESVKEIKIQQHLSSPCVIGTDQKKNFLQSKKYYSINNYPLYVDGYTGSGLTETLLTLSFQNMENNEGVIFIDHKGDNTLYSKVYSFCAQIDRLKDLYVLNLMTPSNKLYYQDSQEYLLGKNIEKRPISHTIEPFNIFISDKTIFSQTFGAKTTRWLYPYLYNIYINNQKISLDSLFHLFSFNTMLDMKNNDYGNQKEITEYLLEIGLHENITNEEELLSIMIQHLENNIHAIKIIQMIQFYKRKGVFSDDPDIDLEALFLERKILTILHPALEKVDTELIFFSHIINNAIYLAEKKNRIHNMHFQNIYMTESNYGLFSINNEDELSNTKNHFIISFIDYFAFENSKKYFYPQNKLSINSFKSFLIMKSYGSNILTKYLFFKYSNFKSYLDFYKKINNFQPGEAFFVDIKDMNSQHSKTFFSANKKLVIQKNIILNKQTHYKGDIKIIPIKCLYYSAKKTNFIKIISHKKGD